VQDTPQGADKNEVVEVPTRGGIGDSGTEGIENPCDGCHECGLRCTSGVQMTEPEFRRIVKHLRTLDIRQVMRVMDQEKMVVWFEDVETEACLFYDVPKQRCMIYPVRPFICRLFGRVEWLPCPLEKPVPQIRNGIELLLDYAGEERATFPEWCAALGHYDMRQLTTE
jgi:hypothetical protein